MPLILGTNSIKDTGYEVANSLRFNSGSSDYLSRTPSSATNQDLWSLSFWIKRSNLGSYQSIYGVYANSTNQETLAFDDSDRLYWQLYQSSAVKGQLTTNRVFRDVSAFYNILIVYDSANGTAGNRMRMYINGVEETSFATDTNPSSGQDSQWNSTTAHTIGRINTANYMNGYMSELVAVDGTALSPTDVGEFDEDSGIWKPIDVSGLTFGTNGFYLPFENSGALGQDDSGNGNNFTVNNLTSVDQSTDTCTNNFATLNPLNVPTSNAPTFSEGNTKVVTPSASGGYYGGSSTIGVSSGKWYFEFITDTNPITVCNSTFGVSYNPGEDARNNWHAGQLNTHNWGYNLGDGKIYYNNTVATYGATFATSDILGMAVDLDNHKIYWSKNNTWQNSGDPTSGSTGTGAFSLDTGQTYFVTAGDVNSSPQATIQINFGNPYKALSSVASDANGYGSFEYAPPSGYYALCTKNLAEFGG